MKSLFSKHHYNNIEANLSGKPMSFEAMAKAAQFEEEKTSLCSSTVARSLSVYHLRESIGFDKTYFNVDIMSLDMKKLMLAKKECDKDTKNKVPRIEITYTDSESDEVLGLPLLEKHNIRSIIVSLSHYTKFVFEKNNSGLTNNGKKMRDKYLLKVYVEPQPGYEYFGNVRNYNYEEMCLVIEKAIEELATLTGIIVNPKTVRLNRAELNITFMQHCNFNHLLRSVSFCQLFSGKNFFTCEYKIPSKTELFTDNTKRRLFVTNYQNGTHDNKCKLYAVMKKIGLQLHNDSLRMKLYDKGEETLDYAAANSFDLKLPEKSLIRLEFEISRTAQVRKYFGNENKPVYFHNLSQEKIEKIYLKLVKKFFIKAYKKYAEDSLHKLKKIVSTIDPTQSNWQAELVKDILSLETINPAAPALLHEKDILSILKCNKTFRKNPEKYSKELLELLSEKKGLEKGQADAYTMLFNFLNKTYNLDTLSSDREIPFTVKKH